MMFRCYECGNLFEDGEQAICYETHGLDSQLYEMFEGCPVCYGAYEEVYQCNGCGEWHSGDELYHGWCEECLRATIDYDTFLEYCEANEAEQYLDVFVMFYLLGEMSCPYNISPEFHQLMVETYKRQAATAKLFNGKSGFLESCISFIMDDDGDCGKENYADWLNKNRR